MVDDCYQGSKDIVRLFICLPTCIALVVSQSDGIICILHVSRCYV